MGCGATKVVQHETEMNNNPVKENINGHIEQPDDRPVERPGPSHKQDEQVEKNADTPKEIPPSSEDNNVITSNEHSKDTTIEKPAPNYTEEALREFIVLENKLSSMESKGVIEQYKTQHKLLVTRYTDLQGSQKRVEKLKQQTAKEYHDVAAMQHPNVRAMFSNVYQLQSRLEKEQREYMDALNRQEVAEKELKSQQEEYNALYGEFASLQQEFEQTQRLLFERDKKLDEIFGGKYGSEREEQLETETELLTQRKDMVLRTKNQWNGAKTLMEHAHGQLAYATRRWAQINTVNPSMIQARYTMIAETRNYLIAASQNIGNTHRYLSNVDIPYCKAQDLKLLNEAIERIFNDIMVRETYIRALQNFSELHGKASSLLQWINMVLEKSINKDLQLIVPLWREKLAALKHERHRLIQVKIGELRGVEESENICEDDSLLNKDEDMSNVAIHPARISEPDTESLKDENDVNIPAVSTVESNNDSVDISEKEVDKHPQQDKEQNNLQTSSKDDEKNESDAVALSSSSENTGENNNVNESQESSDENKEIAALLDTTMKAKPLAELAPVPDVEKLFGNIEELKTKYEEQVAEFSKAQDLNKARLDQALQDKLQTRRSRKQAMKLHDTTELAKGVTTN